MFAAKPSGIYETKFWWVTPEPHSSSCPLSPPSAPTPPEIIKALQFFLLLLFVRYDF